MRCSGDRVRWQPWIGALCALVAAPAGSYPLDGDVYTGIARLRAYREQQDRLLTRGTLHPGSLRTMDEVDVRLAGLDLEELPDPDPELSRRLRAALGAQADRYGVALLDVSDPTAIRYAAHRDRIEQNPGSVGKILVALAWFQALADRYPDVEDRERTLRETRIVADELIRVDTHEVPIWKPGDERIVKRPLRIGDEGSLWTYLDWMLSSSSNAAASMVLEQLVLFRAFPDEPVVTPERAREWFAATTAAERKDALLDALVEAARRNGVDTEKLRQGSLFTNEGKRRIPGTNSTATPHELMRLMLRLEQGRLVDRWSSRELKRLLYMTDRRIRYASHPALGPSAVYFKSGSLYSCAPEPDFVCKKYHGNVRNFMNSVAIVESDEGGRHLHYLVVVLSNVLRENSAVAHQTLGLRIHRFVEALHPPAPAPAPEAEQAVQTAPSAPTDAEPTATDAAAPREEKPRD